MAMNITQKIIKKHIVSGNMTAGEKIAIKMEPDINTGCHRDYGISSV